jgi:hypothetical protein
MIQFYCQPSYSLTPTGGVLVKTPALSAKDNQVSRKVKMELGADGSAKAKLMLISKGFL